MHYPDFFDRVPAITLADPLAALLGAAEEGRITYTYLDAVKLAGHSCPTVAGAYLMALKGLEALYGSALPRRGEIAVMIRGGRDEGSNGVVGNVLGLITGAAGDEGFKGLGGAHARCGLLQFRHTLPAPLIMMRRDSGTGVALAYNPEAAAAAPVAPEWLQRLLSGKADATERSEFGRLWQQRVAAILEARDVPGLISVEPFTE